MIDESRTVTARKSHLCDSCAGRIAPGDRYVRVTMSDDCGINTSCWCTECTDLGAELFAIDIRGEDELGRESYPDLNEVELSEVGSGPLLDRLVAWRRQRLKNVRPSNLRRALDAMGAGRE